ncbi:MAG: hypothetical protein GQ534_10420, partial [Candidatus Delongbacteria bacterium]|nr:hypothetical protein [Candidatus Delongbacteria bacterium]
MKKTILIILLSMILLNADIGDWKTFCSISQGNDIVSSNNKTYIATDGGMLEFNGVENNIYDTDNGLFKINTTAIEVDFRNIVWAGHSDCSISLFNENGNSVGYLSDIEEYGSFNLNRIYSSDDYIYVATDQILVRYSYNSTFGKYDVTDSNLMTGNISDIIVHEGNIYMSTTSGIYMISESNQNIGYLDNWTLLTGFDASTIVNKFLNVGDKVLAFTSNGIYSIDGNAVLKETIEDGFEILWGTIYNNELYYSTNTGNIVYRKSDLLLTGYTDVLTITDPIAERFLINNNIIYYISNSGFSSYSIANSITTNYNFNLPAEKGIKKVKVTQDNSRLLYLTSFGFREFDIFSEEFNEDFYTESKIWWGKDFIEDNEENIYVCTWNTGIAKFTKSLGGYEFEQRYLFSDSFTSYKNGHPGVCKDKSGNLWFTNFNNADLDSTIVKINTDGSITPYTYSVAAGVPANPFNIFVDDNDWVWIGSSSEQFNERDGLSVGIVIEGTLVLNTFSSLGGIIDINRDKKDFVWIGTNNGIKYID